MNGRDEAILPPTNWTFRTSSGKLHVVVRCKRRTVMVARGRVQNGVVVLANGVRLPEGQEVTVLAPSVAGSDTHGILDIPPVSLGSVVRLFTADDDLLGEMLEGRT
jgi:hypothetical protein